MSTNLKNLPLATFKAIVRQIASEKPSFVYKRKTGQDVGPVCVYYESLMVSGEKSRCIIGEALFRLGIDDDRLPKVGTAEEVLAKLGAQVDVFRWGQKVQAAQDAGATWGDAVREADYRDE